MNWQEVKMLLVEFLDKHFPNWCRASLVMWAHGYYSFGKAFNLDDGQAYYQFCKKGKYGSPTSYCGKCEANGNFYKGVKR